MSTIFVRADFPPTIMTRLLATPKYFANTFTTPSLARPSAGGAVTQTLYSPSEIFSILFCDALGITLMYKRIPTISQ